MKAAMMYAVGEPLVIEDVGISNPGPREVPIRTEAVGVCPSDPPSLGGRYPPPLPVNPWH